MQVYRGKGERREPETMNKRQTDILRILYKDRSYVTYGEIAKQLGVSVGTVRNDIAVIKEALARAETALKHFLKTAGRTTERFSSL